MDLHVDLTDGKHMTMHEPKLTAWKCKGAEQQSRKDASQAL